MLSFKRGDIIENRYVVNDIKEGGLGIVYLCYDDLFETPVALKTFKFDSENDWKIALSKFISEAKKWIFIGQAHNVVQAYYIINIEMQHGLTPFVAIELIEGHGKYGNSLRGYIQHSAYDLELILNIAITMCNGMINVQKKLINYNFVHCDLKPENILLSKEGSIKITDFGLSKVLYENASQISSLHQSALNNDGLFTLGLTNNVYGTLPYMSPEQCLGESTLDQRSDIYAVGCILYELCTKKFIFDTDVPSEFFSNHLKKNPIPPSSINSKIPEKLTEIIQKCLAKKPINRPQTFEHLREALMNHLLQECRKGSGVRFFTFGFSALTNNPRVKSDFNMSRESEAILLGKTIGIEYVVKQGLVSSKEEFEKLDSEYERNRDEERKKTELIKKMKIAEEKVTAGDALLRLSESATSEECSRLIRTAINDYQLAKSILPLDPTVAFRCGYANFQLAATLRDEKDNRLSDDMLSVAIEDFNTVLSNLQEAEAISIGTTVYLLPYAALFHRAGAYAIRGQKAEASGDFTQLIQWLKKSDLQKYESMRKHYIDAASEGLEFFCD